MSNYQAQAAQALDLFAELVAQKVAAHLSEQPASVQPEPTPNPEPEPPVIETGGATVDEVRALFVELGKEMGRDAQVSVLAEFDAKKLSEVSEDQYGAVVGVIGSMLKEHRDGV